MNEFLERLSEVTDEDWVDFWASEDPTLVTMNDTKIGELNV